MDNIGNIFVDKPHKYAKIEFDWNLDSTNFQEFVGFKFQNSFIEKGAKIKNDIKRFGKACSG